MSKVLVAVVDESGTPRRGVTVVAYDLSNFPAIQAEGQTDETGSVTLTITSPAFFDAFDRRGVSLRDRNYPGRIQIQILNMGNAMNADYVVDSNGFGTHTALYGASGALAAAIADAANRAIWICTTHVEPTVTATQSLDSLAANQVITIFSGSDYRPSLPVGASIDLHSTSTLATSGHRIVYRNVQFSVALTFTANLFSFQAAGNSPVVELENVHFAGAGTWRSAMINGPGTSSSFYAVNCTGTLTQWTSVCGVSSSNGNLGFNGNTGSSTDLLLDRCKLTLTNIIFRIADTHAEPASNIRIVDNTLVLSSYAFQMTFGSTTLIVGNTITAAYNDRLFQWGTTGGIDIRAVFTGNYVTMAGGGSSSRVIYTNNFTGGVGTEFTVVGNSMRGPGSGNAIEVGSSAGGTMVLEPNGFYNWTAPLTGGGVKTTFWGPITFSGALTVTGLPFTVSGAVSTAPNSAGIVLNTTDNNDASIALYRTTIKAYMTIVRTAGNAPFAANDHLFGTNDGSFHNNAAFDTAGTVFKMRVALQTINYGYFGTGATFAAPTNTTAGALTLADKLYAGTVVGSITNASAGTLTLQSTTHATKGKILFGTSGYDEANNRLGLGTASPGVQLDITASGWVGGYLRVGAESAPGNTTAGDITGVRFFINNDSNFAVYVSGGNPSYVYDSGDYFFYDRTNNRHVWAIGNTNLRYTSASGDDILGYLHAGSLTAPLNTTAGDITGVRLTIGTDTTRGASTGYFANVTGTVTDTASGAKVGMAVGLSTDPAGASASEFRAFVMSVSTPSANTQDFSQIHEAIFAFNQPDGTGNYTGTAFGGLIGVLAIGATSSAATGGTISAAAGLVGLGINFGASVTKTVTTARGVYAPNPSAIGGATISTYIGMDIDALTKFTVGTGRIGFRNADTTVFTPTATQSIAVSAAISASATVVKVSTTTAANMTATPTVADGSDGQILIIVNVGANTFTLQDQGTLASSNLRLSAATVAISTRSSIMLMYSSTVGDWIQIGQTTVL